MHRILIAPDKFKGTLTSDEAARAIEKGIRRAWPDAKTTRFTLTDGGEGFVEMLVKQTRGKLRSLSTVDAAGRPRRAIWGVLGDARTAVVGLNEASGLAHLPERLRNPERTSNAGTGRIIQAALKAGFREILVGLGGSATTEGGISLAAAIGYQFLERDGKAIPLTGAGLYRLDRIVAPTDLPQANFVVATDVGNPLCGRHGAAFQFGPQKGADPAMVRRLDEGLRRLARIVKRDLGRDLARVSGAGAAGGCGYGLMAFFGARREEGFHLVKNHAGLEEIVRQHDLVITGEGSFDRTSLFGKAPSQLADLARQHQREVWALCGRVQLARKTTPFHRIAELGPLPIGRKLSIAQHSRRLEELAYRVAQEARPRV